jgi:hypothetical protein
LSPTFLLLLGKWGRALNARDEARELRERLSSDIANEECAHKRSQLFGYRSNAFANQQRAQQEAYELADKALKQLCVDVGLEPTRMGEADRLSDAFNKMREILEMGRQSS